MNPRRSGAIATVSCYVTPGGWNILFSKGDFDHIATSDACIQMTLDVEADTLFL